MPPMQPILPPPAKVKRRPNRAIRFLGFLFTTGVVMFLAAAAGAAVILWKVSNELPNYDALARYEPPVMTRIHANDGSLLAEFARERRIYVPINTVPPLLIRAVLSAEDKNFYEHSGVDFGGVVRAVFNRVVKGQRLTGASTITQQVAKNFLLSGERSFDRKIKEAILSVRIERAFTKDEILELYLNEIYLGLSSYGVAAAALNYYGKELDELTVAEAAYMAALPKAPNNYHPFKRKRAAKARRDWVIQQMQRNGFISIDQMKEAIATPLEVNLRPFGAQIFAAEYFAEEVRRDLIAIYGEDKLYGGGLSVRTTLDPTMQRYAKEVLVRGLVGYDRRAGFRRPVKQVEIGEDWGQSVGAVPALGDVAPWRLAIVLQTAGDEALIGLQPPKLSNGEIDPVRETGVIPVEGAKWAGVGKKGFGKLLSAGDIVYVAPLQKKGEAVAGQWELMQVPEVEGAIMAMDPHTGRVLALVGGFSFADSQFDRAVQAKRQPGSSFKPFVYATALDNGYTPSTIVLDAPIVIEQLGQNDWKPENYSGKFYGPSTLRLGIELSRNLMTVRLAQDVGMPLIAEYARRFGVYDDLYPVLSMALGAGETTLLRMATGYSVLANGGRKVNATLIDRIQDRRGATIWRHDDRDCIDCKVAEWNNGPEPDLPDNRRQVIDPHTAYQITSMMEGVVERGTGATAMKGLGVPLAGKTGTTNDEKDAWFMGYTPDMVVGVYIGYDNPKPMGKGSTGGGLAAPVVRAFLDLALNGKAAVPFRIPPGIKLVRINRKTGMRAASNDPNAIMEPFKPDSEPPDAYTNLGTGQGTDYWSSTGSRGLNSGLY